MANPTSKQLSANLSKRLANFKLSDAAINRIAERSLIKGLELGKLGPCPYGICGDYFTNKRPKLDGLVKNLGIVKWEVFPYGIIGWDRYRVQIAFEVDELQGRVNEVAGR